MNDSVNAENGMERVMDVAANKRKGYRTFNRLGWAFVIFLAAQIVLPSVIVLTLTQIAPSLSQSWFFGMPLVYTCMYLVAFPLMLLLLRKTPDHTATYVERKKTRLGVGTLLALYPISFTVMSAFSILAGLVEKLIGKTATVTTADLVASDTPAWIYFVFGVLVAPIMEEIVFRRLTYKKVSGYGAGVYIGWTAVLFGLFHLNFGQSIYAGILGAIFAIIMYKTGSVLYTCLLHLMINFTGGVGMGSVILRSGSDMALTIYSAYTILLWVLGVVLGVIFLLRKFFVVKTEVAAGEVIPLSKKTAFLNPGTIVFCVICLAIIIAGFFV